MPILGPSALSSSQQLGVDVSCLSDLDPYFSLVSGPQCLAQDLVHGITTQTGSLFYDEAWGIDVRQQLNGPVTPQILSQLGASIQAQWSSDERVQSATAQLDWNADAEVLTITGSAVPVVGQPFQFIVAATGVTVALLSVT